MLLPSPTLSSLSCLLLLPFLPSISAASPRNPSFQPATILEPDRRSEPPPPPHLTTPSSGFEKFKLQAGSIFYAATGLDLGSVLGRATDVARFQAEEEIMEDERDGVVRIDDSNWERVVELEDLPEGVKEEDRVWCIVVHGPKTDAMTTQFYNAHSLAANMTKAYAANSSDPLDMRHVSFARVSYLDVTELTTRWLIFKPPYFIFASNRGKDLRFLSLRSVRPDGVLLRGVLAKGGWKDAPIWQSVFAPGGSLETPLIYAGKGLAIFYERAKNIPRVVWLLLSGIISQQMLHWMHGGKSDKKTTLPPVDKKQIVQPAGSDEARAVADALRRRVASKPVQGEGIKR